MVEATARLILRYEWDLFVTLTTRAPQGPEIWVKRYRTWIRRIEKFDQGLGLAVRPIFAKDRIRHVVAWEPQRRGAIHLHCLLAAPGLIEVSRRWMRADWNRLCTPAGPIIEERHAGVDWLVGRNTTPRGKRGFEIAGGSKIELIRSQALVAGYCSKYVVKGGQIDLFRLPRA